MKILFSQYALAENRGGSELFITEIATELHRRGHSVVVYAGEVGTIAEELRQQGVDVLDDPRNCPWTPDIIHGQHRIHALKALLAFPGTPALLYIHGLLPPLEKPFIHPRILRYVTTSRILADRWADGIGISNDRIEVIHNHIDLKKFDRWRIPLEKPRTALLYSNKPFKEKHLAAIRSACEDQHMRFDLGGLCGGTAETHPENLLPQYDLVFAVGRSALEAMASGCGVIPVYDGMADELILPQNYERLRKQNMAVRLSVHEKLTPQWLKTQICRWDSEAIREVSETVRKEACIESTVDRLEGIYGQVLKESSSLDPVDFDEELDAISILLGKDAYTYIRVYKKLHRSLVRKIKKQAYQMDDVKNSLSWKLTAPLRWIQNRVVRYHR